MLMEILDSFIETMGNSYLVNILTFFAVSGTAVLTLIGTGLYFFQERLLYYPSMPPGAREDVPVPSQFGFEKYEEIKIPTEDGLNLHGFFVPVFGQDPKAPTIILFHGNAGNAGHRCPLLTYLVGRCNANVLLFDYRGYGKSDGEFPSEEGLKKDADAALSWVARKDGIAHNKIFLFGRSLGGAIATDLAVRNPSAVRGLILENTFTSIASMVDALMPQVAPLKGLILNIKWDSEAIIDQVNVPILFLSGRMDELVPCEMMDKLHEKAKTMNDQTTFVPFPYGSHMETYLQPDYDPSILAFIR